MSLAINTGETPARAVRRVARKRIGEAIAILKADGELDDQTVHEVRRCCKEARGVLRLARRLFGTAVYERENRALRDASRPLSRLRDATVLIGALDELIERSGGRLDAARLASLRLLLRRQRLELRRRLVQRQPCLPRIVRSLTGARQRASGWRSRGRGWKALSAGLKRTYRQGREAMQAARSNRAVRPQPSNEALHEWRKRTKSFRYALEFLQGLRPGKIRPLARRAHQLTNLLGEDHDLAVLGQISQRHFQRRSNAAASALRRAIDQRRSLLQRRAGKLGEQVFSEPVRAFADRLDSYRRH